MKQRKLNFINSGHALGVTSIGLLSLLMVALLCPVSRNDSYATDSITTQAEVIVNPTIAVGVQSKVSMEITPDTAGKFTSSEATVTVNTNSADGYALYMNTMYGPNLTSSDASNTTVIAPLSVDATVETFAVNSWGYSLDDEAQKTYHPVPDETGEAVHRTNTSTMSNELTLTFAAMIDTNLQAGIYSNMVTISAVANPVTVSGLAQLTYMQNMTSDICANTAYDVNGNMNPTEADLTHPVTKQLTDTRDGKKYWVAKLADGNCWMTQNLALNLGTAPDAETEAELGKFVSELTPADSDVESKWVPKSNTNAIELNGGTISGTDYSNSWNIGKRLLVNPLATSSYVGVDINSDWDPVFSAQAGEYDGTYYNYVTANQTAKTYDAHYLVGNLYQYGAATAGTGDSINTMNGIAPSSICPKGWRLPAAGMDQNNYFMPVLLDDSYFKLLTYYGLPSDLDEYVLQSDKAYFYFTDKYSNFRETLVESPLYIAQTGVMWGSTYEYDDFGRFAIYTSNTTINIGMIQTFFTGYEFLLPSNNDGKSSSLTIRCLAY